MALFYEIRDSNNAVVETGKGFATLEAAKQLAEKAGSTATLGCGLIAK